MDEHPIPGEGGVGEGSKAPSCSWPDAGISSSTSLLPITLTTDYLISYLDARKQSEMVVVVPRESPRRGTVYAYPPSSRPLTVNPQRLPNPHSTQARPSPPSRDPSYDQSRDHSHGPSRARRRSSQNVSQRSESSLAHLAAEGYNPVQHVSRSYDDAGLRFNTPMTKDYSSEDASFSCENQAVSLGARSGNAQYTKTNGHHDVTSSLGNHGDEFKVATEEIQSKSVDEEENSSDGSDASFFNCGQCGKSFAQRSVLQIHVCPNMPYKPYHCGHCTQSFDHPNELRMHAVIHAGEKPFKCGYCSRSFAGATTLHNHVRTHTGEKPFSCERCGKTFTQASQLHKHEGIPGDCVPFDSLHD